MTTKALVHLVPYLGSLAISAGVGMYAIRRRSVRGATPLAVQAFSMGAATLCYILELLSPAPSDKIFWDNVQFLWMFAAPGAFLLFTLRFTGARVARPTRTMLILAAAPLVFLLIVFTDGFHRTVRHAYWIVPGEPFSELGYDFSAAFILMASYAYGLLIAGAVLLAGKLSSSDGLYRTQIWIVLAAVSIPLAGTLVTLLGAGAPRHRDTMPFTFAATNLLIVWGLYRHRLFDIVPAAKDAVIDTMADAVVVIDAQNRVVDANASARKLLALPADAILGGQAGGVFSRWPHLNEMLGVLVDIHTEIALGTGGEERHYELDVTPLRDRRDRVTGRLIVAHDITERTRVERELRRHQENLEARIEERTVELRREIRERTRIERTLRESEEKYRLLVENANDAILIAQDGMMKFHNPKLAAVTGYGPEELATRPFVDFVYPEDRGLVAGHYAKRLAGEKAPDTYGFRIMTKSGETRSVEINAVRIAWEGRPAVLGFVRDITTQKQLERQFLQSQKMEAVGTLAGGIAHDFNNILQAVLGFTQMLLDDRDTGTVDVERLREIEKAALRASELTRQLLIFSRKVESKLRPVDLNHELRQTARLLRRTIPRMIDIELSLEGNLRIIDADPAQIEQVLMNLGINARDAMPDGGTLAFKTENVHLDEDFSRIFRWAKPGDYVLLTVSDTGSGMAPEVHAHVFEPFYTTKPTGKGTGLGLAMAYGTVKNHGGHITCESASGEGTVFRLYFPATDASAREPDEGGKRTDALSCKGSETILFVDDEEFLRKLGANMLSKFGYEVITAEDGEKAIEIYRSRSGEIQLVILDLIMPGMGGERCLKELRRIDPGARVLVASGYSQEGTLSGLLEKGALRVVGKPYEINTILRAVRDTLDGG